VPGTQKGNNIKNDRDILDEMEHGEMINAGSDSVADESFLSAYNAKQCALQTHR
jgi:hypothetical protein